MPPDFCTPLVCRCLAFGQTTAGRNLETGHHLRMSGIHLIALFLTADTCNDTHHCHASRISSQESLREPHGRSSTSQIKTTAECVPSTILALSRKGIPSFNTQLYLTSSMSIRTIYGSLEDCPKQARTTEKNMIYQNLRVSPTLAIRSWIGVCSVSAMSFSHGVGQQCS